MSCYSHRCGHRLHIMMSVELQVRKTRQALNHVASNVTHLTNTLVSKVVETPQLYVNTKLRVLNAIGSLPEGVMELQQAWEEMHYELKRAGLAFPLEEEEDNESKPGHKAPKRTAMSAEGGVPKRGRKKKETLTETSLPPAPPAPVPLEEIVQDHADFPIVTETS